VGLAIRGAFARLVERFTSRPATTVVVPPPAFVVMNAKSSVASSDLSFAKDEPLTSPPVVTGASVQ
jgi:hypothetical protein